MKLAPILLALAACSDSAGAVEPPVTAPKLVVVMVIDQWPEWAFEAHRPELRGGGFDRLLAEGEWHVGRHPTAVTLTAPGHALIGTGKTGRESGIVANEWYRPDLGKVLKSVEAEDRSVSAKWLRVPGLGDAVAASGTGAKAISVSLKDRAAVLPLGHAGTAIYYDARTVDWQVMGGMAPPWLDSWNHSNPVAFHLHDVWEPSDRDRLKALSKRRDFEVGEVGEKGFGATFPHEIDRTRAPAEAVLATPLGNQLVLDTALAAVDGEKLGHGDAPDLLVVSLSAHDYIAHGWGHESWEAWDGELRLDAALGKFLAGLDAKVGRDRWAMVVTSDHGASHLPEISGGGRLRYAQIHDKANAAASTVLGQGEWIADAEFPTIFLTEAARTSPEREQGLDAVIAAVKDMPGIAEVRRSADLVGNCEERPELDRWMCNAIDGEREGELFYVSARNWILEDDDEPMAASHGSPYDYDQLVPLLVLAPGRVTHAPLAAPDGPIVPMTEVAAIAKRWLGVR